MKRLVRRVVLAGIAQWTWVAQAATPSPVPTPAPTQLPLPCQPGTCASNTSFVSSGAATAVAAGNKLTVTQTSNNATLNWSSFNIGANGKVVFQQPSSQSIALNRIFDANPSAIFGSVSANGQIYLINPNGFLFGAHSTVNVAGMIASSLNITDSTFANGILNPIQNQKAALEPFYGSTQNFLTDRGSNGQLVPALVNTGVITVQNGAQLTAADGGRLLLAAATVDNAGSLTAPDGQIVLAAGQSVYLQAAPSTDTALRGLIVQVDAGSSAAQQLQIDAGTVTVAGKGPSDNVINEATGSLSTARGNITLAGLMINQDGRLSATTSVAANGSVILTAGSKPAASLPQIAETIGGEITLGASSDIEILPELTDTATAVAAQPQLPSTVSITGQNIYLHGGTIRAPSGDLAVTATPDPAASAALTGYSSAASLRIDAGTTIDLSGSDATLPMSANLIQVQLRSNEFADDPTQRNGALRGDTVTVDIRADGGKGSPIADLTSAIAAVGQTIAQRTEAGGTAAFQSLGDIVFSPGASLNVSAGSTTYLGGTIQTTKLVGANGQIYDIGSANPLLTYVGVVNPTYTQTYNKWGVQDIVPTPGLSQYVPTYQQGATAGTVQFAAPSMALGGNLVANSLTGPYQRGSSTLGGTLIIGEPNAQANSGTGLFDYLAPSIQVVTSPTPIVVGDTASLPVQTLQLPSNYLTAAGFTNLELSSNSSFKLPSSLPLVLPAGTALSVLAPRIDIDSSITALGGAMSFESQGSIAESTANFTVPGIARLGIGVGDGVALNVAGQWTNDSVLSGGSATGPTLQNGGSINLQLTQPGSELVLGDNVALKADAGAWEQAAGNLSFGSGGKITLDASPALSAMQFGTGEVVEAFGAGTQAGGSFTLLAPQIALSSGTGTAWTEAQRIDDLPGSGAAAAPGGVLQLYSPLLSKEGFANIALTATGAATAPRADTLTVEASPQSAYVLQQQTLLLDPGFQTRASGGTIAGFSQLTSLLPYQRPATNLSLSVSRLPDDQLLGSTNYGNLEVQTGATISADQGAKIAVSGEGGITIGGTLRAPAGDISVNLLTPADSPVATIIDPGYVAGLGITLTPSAVIDVSAQGPVLAPNNQGLLLGTVPGGGNVSVSAQRGTVVVAAGAQIDFSGTSATLDVPNASTHGYTHEVVASPGGSLAVSSVESIELLGSLQGHSGGSGAAGGSLEIDLTRPLAILGQPGDAGQPLELDVVANAATAGPPAIDFATIGLTQILGSTGVDALTLNAGGPSPGIISLQTNVPIALNRSVTLESETLSVPDGTAASIAAPYVEIGNPQTLLFNGATQPKPTAGTGILTVAANQATLLGNVTLQGIGDLTVASQGDIQLQGTQSTASTGGLDAGSLVTAGNVTLQAERVYPVTFTSFTIDAQSGAGVTNVNIDPIRSNGNALPSPGTPLSGGGQVTVAADRIEIGGDLYAPLGQINLTASQSLQLSDGSLVSVSGGGLDIPYGQTELGATAWQYLSGLNPVTALPVKAINLAAPNVSVQHTAQVDLQGGGDLYAYEWVPGTGGTTDALASPANGGTPGLYAIIPSQAGLATPFDPQESVGYSPGNTVYLSGGAGVAPGNYALLPPRYALLPGALLIAIEPSYTSATGGQIGALANGTPVIGGYRSYAGTNLSAGSTTYEGFAIYPSGYGQQLATYTISQASTYFGTAAKLAGTGPVSEPADAGVLNLSVNAAASNSLSLLGTVETQAANGGLGAVVNLSAPNLELSADGSASAGFLGLSSTVLQGWNAGELTLGGSTITSTKTNAAGNPVSVETVTVAANQVLVADGASLTANQIYLVAHQGIEVASGASLASTSGAGGTPLKTLPTAQTVGLSDASAAFLAVSDLNLPLVTRTGAGAGGSVTLDAGSSVKSGGALVLDAPTRIAIADGTVGGAGANWSLASNTIAFVGNSSAQPDALNIDASLLQSLQSAGAVRLASQGNIDLYAPVALGATSASATPNLSALTLLATTIDNQNSGSSVFGAKNLTLGSVSAPGILVPATGSGALSLVANALTLAPNGTDVSGFNDTQLQVYGPVTSAAGSVSGLDVGGNLTINASQINPGVAASTALTASGNLSIGAATTPTQGTPVTTAVGGALAVQAAAIVDDGAIVAPSGIVSLTATAGDVQIGGKGSITVAGTLLQAVNQSAPTPGGTIAISATGNVMLGSGTTLNVSGEQVAPAGAVNIVGAGQVTLAGTLTGAAGSGGSGGDFSLDAGQLLGGLSPVAASLTSGGFSDSVSVRVRSGDLSLPSGTLTATTINLTADQGTVDIGGSLNAPAGVQHGLIDLSANNVVLESGATLTSIGGEIELNAGDAFSTAAIQAATGTTPVSACAACAITLNPGSTITTVGNGAAGQVILRAPALQSSDDVAINLPVTGISGLGANVSNAGQMIIEPVLAYSTNNATVGSDLPNDVTSASGFLTTATPVIQQRLAPSAAQFSSATPPLVEVGVELIDPVNENLALTAVPGQPIIDLQQYSTGAATGMPQVINLAVRAVGSVTVNGTISDGFVADSYPDSGTGLLALSPNPSASFSLVAGADTSSASLLSTLRGSNASLTLATMMGQSADGTPSGAGPSVVRTGTGDITLVAAGDVVFQADAGGAAAVYTGGELPANAPPVAYSNTLLMNFGQSGGNVRIAAGGNVISSPVGLQDPQTDSGDFGVTGWLLHQGSPGGLPAQYGTDYGNFDWNVGALGGGDVSVSAGGNINSLSAAAADSLAPINGVPTLLGAGGGLSLRAGGDIGTPQLYVADGTGSVIAGGGLTTTETFVGGTKAVPISSPVGAAIALGNSAVSVWARNSLQVDAIYNPTDVSGVYGNPLNGNYLTYGADSAVNLSSTTGTVTLELQSQPNSPLGTLLGADAVNNSSNYTLIAPTLAVQAPQANILLSAATVNLAPSSTGQLSLFAGQDIQATTLYASQYVQALLAGQPLASNANASIAMSDAFASTYPTAADLSSADSGGNPVVPFAGLIHGDDPNSVLVTAGRDIRNLNLSVPKPAQVVAGRDLVNLGFVGQNIAPSDITLIEAGRDLNNTGLGSATGLQLGGPGSFDVLTGRNLNFGLGAGLVTLGNLANPNLPSSQGADANVMVGYGSQGADLSNFLAQIIAKPTSSYDYQKNLIDYVESLNGASGLTFAAAEQDFTQLSTQQQSALIDQVFFDELLASGREANSLPGVGFTRGYAAIDALYPGSRSPTASTPSPYAGDLTLTFSQIYTDSGGNISILVPGGSINVGLANPPASISSKNPSSLGIVAEGTGNVNIYSLGDVNVNQSRVFTLGGGNILIWSTLGSIDAGNGSKSSLSVPPPTVSVSKTGGITLNFGGALATGSGIRTIQTSPEVPAGDVDLDAPVGTVNAGDAGIGAAGNINIAAAHVIGVDNINFGGTATGVPSDVSNLGATLAGASNAAAGTQSSSANSAEEAAAKEAAAAPIAQAQLSWLDVFVTGLGEDNCKPDDLECLKKQKAAVP
jgi:filamentous hemagglutinin family protein